LLQKFLQVELVVNSRLLLKGKGELGLLEREFDSLVLQISTPERAILEVMQQVPGKVSYEEGYLLMENLSNLRPTVVQKILENCISIKAKRLFLHCADKCRHPWLTMLDLDPINLGRGKRMIGKGGNLDQKYQLSVPKIRSE